MMTTLERIELSFSISFERRTEENEYKENQEEDKEKIKDDVARMNHSTRYFIS
jgi:hypothetical protein